jgi:hypothetical protein
VFCLLAAGGMQAFARLHGIDLPYLHNETRAVTCAYGAVCTQDFFGFDRERRLQYRGRPDESGHPPQHDPLRSLGSGGPLVAGGGSAPPTTEMAAGSLPALPPLDLIPYGRIPRVKRSISCQDPRDPVLRRERQALWCN